jgi:hypothetical protein
MRMPASINPAPMRSQPPLLLAVLTVVLAMLGAAGCATTSGEPFSALATSAQQLRDGADASLGAVYERVRDRLLVPPPCRVDRASIARRFSSPGCSGRGSADRSVGRTPP